MKIYRVFALILTLVFALSLASCGSSGGAGTSAEDTSSAELASSVPETQSDAENTSSAPETPGDGISIVVLGDSIARGYGLQNVERERYSALLSDLLKECYERVDITNYGIDGQTGKELADSLASNPPAELSGADAVIISIGGNNMLTRLGELFKDSDMLKEGAVEALKEYFTNLLATDAVGKSRFEAAAAKISQMVSSINSVFESENFKSLLNDAVSKLRDELPAIVSAVREAGAKRILVQTIYNPYYDTVISLRGVDGKLDLATRGEQAVAELNNVIRELADENGYEIVEIHDAFSASLDRLTNAGIDLSSAVSGFPLNFGVDPHPNAAGHRLIAELIKEKLLG